jgi:hypothetical protein
VTRCPTGDSTRSKSLIPSAMYGDAADRQLMNRPFSATRSRLTPNDIIAESRDALPRYLSAEEEQGDVNTALATPSPRELVALETELLQLHESELRELQEIGARVAAREQNDWEEGQIAALVRPHSAAPAFRGGSSGGGAYNRLQSPPRPQSARQRRAPDGSPADHLSSSAISDLRAELHNVPYSSGRPGSARRAEQLSHDIGRPLALLDEESGTVQQLQALAAAQASSPKQQHEALRARRRQRAIAAEEAAAAAQLQLALRRSLAGPGGTPGRKTISPPPPPP